MNKLKLFSVGVISVALFAAFNSNTIFFAEPEDEDVRLTSTLVRFEYYTISEGEEVLDFVETYARDANNNITEYIGWCVDEESETHELICDEKIDYEYDDKNNNTKILNYRADEETGEFSLHSFTCYEYNDHSDITQETRYRLDDGEEVLNLKVTYEYDSNYNCLKYEKFNLHGGNLVLNYRQTYEYDQNLLTKQCDYNFDEEGTTPVLCNQHEYKYNEKGLQTQLVDIYYNTSTGEIRSVRYVETTYDEQDRKTSSIYSNYKDVERTIDDKDYGINSKQEYEYGENSTTYLLSYYNYTTHEYIPNTKDYKYEDNDVNIQDRWSYNEETQTFEYYLGEKATAEYDEYGRMTCRKDYERDTEATEAYECTGISKYTYTEIVTPKSSPVLAIILITVGSLVVVAGGLYLGWFLEGKQVGFDSQDRKLKFLDKPCNFVKNLFKKKEVKTEK